jgi:hypothetical protein
MIYLGVSTRGRFTSMENALPLFSKYLCPHHIVSPAEFYFHYLVIRGAEDD